jgi:hypothetical protein
MACSRFEDQMTNFYSVFLKLLLVFVERRYSWGDFVLRKSLNLQVLNLQFQSHKNLWNWELW